MDKPVVSDTQPELTDLEKRQHRDIFLRHYANAQAYFSDQNYKESFKEIRKAGEIDPLNIKLARLAIEIFKRTQNADGLITLCQKMINIDPQDTEMQINLALGFFWSEAYPVVIDMTTHLLTLELIESEELACMELLADSFRKKNDFEKAKSLYLKILDKVDNPARILFKLTTCYYRMEDHKNVVVTTSRLIDMGYNNQDITDLYNKSVEHTQKNIGKIYKPRNLLTALFRSGYDPLYARLMNLD